MDNIEPQSAPAWFDSFDERQKSQIRFSRLYEREYHHGADGHNNMMIIAKMARYLDAFESQKGKLEDEQ